MPRTPAPPIPPWTRAHYVGVDENGMGPRLGPLVVTSVLAEVDAAGAKVVASKPRGATAKRIGDSKKLVAFEDSRLGEAWARAITARAGLVTRSPAELLSAIALDPEDTLRAPCPSHHVDLCWNTDGETFLTDAADVATCGQDLARLEARGVRIHRARVGIVCTRRLNEAVAHGQSRFDVDLHTMERLALDARDHVNDEVYALCGKVGGFDFYGPRFGPLGGRLHTVLVEGRARSEYAVPGVGRLAFIRDADENSLIVGLASLVGKWVRDHLMRRVVRYHRNDGADLPDASGYHDPVTARFIEASELVRKHRRVDPSCFERTSLGKRAGRTSTSSRSRQAPRPPTEAPNPKLLLEQTPREEA